MVVFLTQVEPRFNGTGFNPIAPGPPPLTSLNAGRGVTALYTQCCKICCRPGIMLQTSLPRIVAAVIMTNPSNAGSRKTRYTPNAVKYGA